jgi:hypothetical protein
VIELVRRIEAALHPHAKAIELEGQALWDALGASAGESTPTDLVVELLRAMAALDRLGDVLATWAVDREPARPDDEVDAVVAEVAQRLDALGVPREEPPRPRARRS